MNEHYYPTSDEPLEEAADLFLVGNFDELWSAYDTRTEALTACLEAARQNILVWIIGEDPFFCSDYDKVFETLNLLNRPIANIATPDDEDDSWEPAISFFVDTDRYRF